jgi:hypothetical protein
MYQHVSFKVISITTYFSVWDSESARQSRSTGLNQEAISVWYDIDSQERVLRASLEPIRYYFKVGRA